MKLLLFGTGEYYQRYKKWFDREDILALLDNAREKQGTAIDGIPVLSPKEGTGLSYDAVVVLSFYVKQMRAQLLDLGVPDSCIYHFFDLHDMPFRRQAEYPVKVFGDVAGEEQILLLSHDLTLGGPAIALFHAAELLKRNGYPVVVASMLDGPLREILQQHDIPVVVDVNLQWKTMEEVSWAKTARMIICNTVSYFLFLTKRDTRIPVVWWLHDSSFFYDGIREEVLRGIDCTNLTVVSVGPVPARAIERIVPKLPVQKLIYGVADHARRRRGCRSSDRVVFVTIGYIEARKGQDILVNAVEQLMPDMREKAVFYLVGQNTSMLAIELKSRIGELPQIQMTGTVGRSEVNRILEDADVLICPSREDPMPTVAAEAMMHGVPCLVSDATGTAAYIRHGEDGLVFPCGDVQALSEQIAWCIGHRAQVEAMRDNARELYRSKFSMETFEKNFMHLVKEVLEGR